MKNPQGIIVDKVGFGLAKDFEKATAQNPPAGQSIQRKWNLNYDSPQDTNNNSVDFQIFNAPTPKAPTPRFYLFDNFSFTQDTILKKSLSPYLFKNNISVSEGVTLTIEPGVVIKFFDTGSNLNVAGTVKAIGTDADKIVFTSFSDDEYGGDTNGDGSLSSPSDGEWRVINFTNNSSGSEFEDAVFRYGGAYLPQGAAVKVEQSSISIKNSIFEKNLNRGLYLLNSLAVIANSRFLNQQRVDMWSDFNAVAIHAIGGNVQITDNYFKDNNYGVFIELGSIGTGEADVNVQNNNFENNWHPVILNTFNGPSFSGNKILGDADALGTIAAIWVRADMEKDTILEPDLPYLFDKIMVVPEGMTLTLKPGVIMAFQDNWDGLQIGGTLKAVGTSDKPIIFRSYYYDRDWILPGGWNGLWFLETSKDSDLESVDVNLSGAFYADGRSFGAAIRVDQSSILLKNSIIQHNKNNGVWLQNSSSVVDNVKFLDHRTQIYGITPGKAVFVQGGSPTINNSSFQDQPYGIYEDEWIKPDTSAIVCPTPILNSNTFSNSEIKDIFETDKSITDCAIPVVPAD
ncbi:MAG: right-handed parallel beta-helix repeat-containing protein [Candidatus Staskawiczbacteria bacterium]|nr:right-handed parallel beta-helix repeat-containing protein [Candidatus Staskawiczbacteria bacterium]